MRDPAQADRITQMNQLQKEAKTYLKDLLAQGHEAQRKRLKNVWEPEVIAIMDATANQCLAVARLMIKRYTEAKPDAASYAGLQQPLNRAWASIVAGRTEQAKQVIQDGVRSLARSTAESLTIGGLAAPVPTLESLHPIEAEIVDDLAGGKELDSYVARHCSAFSKAVAAQLRLAKPGNEAKLDMRLEAAAAMFRVNLHTVARTMLFQAAHQTQRAVTRPLSAA